MANICPDSRRDFFPITWPPSAPPAHADVLARMSARFSSVALRAAPLHNGKRKVVAIRGLRRDRDLDRSFKSNVRRRILKLTFRLHSAADSGQARIYCGHRFLRFQMLRYMRSYKELVGALDTERNPASEASAEVSAKAARREGARSRRAPATASAAPRPSPRVRASAPAGA
ncbi:hypothetical protein EVAR_64942_1 [Eumeta japonica]|uniref:Uncharacterized protein n=1 Tax=Eumeta variegata TaxID=151549 RepID=A0A4C1ZDT5_EUMVA|nr:hypothetical protein EVAR_64942_1 [Eumeta japonica]